MSVETDNEREMRIAEASTEELVEESLGLIQSLIIQGRVHRVAEMINSMDPIPCLLYTMQLRVKLPGRLVEKLDRALCAGEGITI